MGVMGDLNMGPWGLGDFQGQTTNDTGWTLAVNYTLDMDCPLPPEPERQMDRVS